MNDCTLLHAMNGIDERILLRTWRLLEYKEEHHMLKQKKLWRSLLIAAVLVSLFSVTAFAVARFSMSSRPPAEGETFSARFGPSGDWGMEYVFEFEGPSECQAVQFKPGWTPTEDYWATVGPDEDGWATLLEAGEIYNEEYKLYQAACVVDVMYAPQFIDGGAMILSGWQPGPIVEDTWGDVQVYMFQAVATHAMNLEGTAFATGSFVILFHPEQGWIVSVRGHDSMENIKAIAEGLQIRQTEQLIRQEDFEQAWDSCDIYIG
ncbi:MAG: hypothetical protein J5927_00955 [Oscillospiraceae bacterium]|nr:hypothetical protein [Oscillospiraceae bacterium]